MQENPFQEERQGRNVDNLMKVGMGYDVHRLTENRNLILGGVKIPWEKGLLGHSDADVLIHAIWMLFWELQLLEILDSIFQIQIRHTRGFPA